MDSSFLMPEYFHQNLMSPPTERVKFILGMKNWWLWK